MTTQANRKNTKLIVLGVLALIIIGLLAGKFVIESKIKAWAREDLSLYEPMLKLESANVGASFFGSNITYTDVVYSMPDLPGMTIRIGKLHETGIDRDTLMGKPGDITTIEKVEIENFTVSVDKLEQPILEMGKYEVTDLAFNYRDTRATLLQSKGSDDPMAIFKALAPVMKASVNKVGPSKMENLKINMKQADLVDVRLGLATSSGFRELDRETEGFDGALDEAVYKDITMDGIVEYDTTFTASLDSIIIKGLKYNYRELFDALASFSERQDPTILIAGIIPTLYNYEFSEIRAENLKVFVPGAKADFKMASLSFGPRNIKEQGPNVVSKINMTFNGMEVFTLDAIGMDKLVLSDMVVDFVKSPDKYISDMSFLMQVSEDPFMLFKGTRVENLYLTNLNVQGMASLSNWRADVDMGDTVNISSKFNSLYLSPIALNQVGMFMYGAGYAQDTLGMLASRPDGVTMDSNFDLNMDIQKNRIGYSTAFDLTMRQLGVLAFKMDGITAQPKYYETYGDPLLGSLEASISDNGMLESIYNYMASQGEVANAAAVKANLLNELSAELPRARGLEAKLLSGLRMFMERGGRLVMKMKPDTPMTFDYYKFMNTPEVYRLEIIHEALN